MGTPSLPIANCCVRCVIQLRPGDYEERITFWKTAELDEAVEKALAEARTYAGYVGGVALDFAQSYGMDESPTEDGAEVFSLIRQSDLSPREYVDTFFDTGLEFIRRDGDE